MASKFAASDINALLDCPICLDRFSQTNLPKILPCSHNVCAPCLQGLLVGHRLGCPICRKETSVQDGDVNMLITNLQTLQLADLQPLVKCQVCQQECKTSQCFHCEEKVCSECLHKHTEETKSKMRELQKRLNKNLTNAEEFKKKLDGEMLSVESSALTQTERINTQFEMLIKQLQTRRDYLIQEVNTYLETTKHQYQQINKMMEQKLLPLRSVINEVRDEISDVTGKLTKQMIGDKITTGMRIITELGQTLPKCAITFPKIQLQAQIEAVVCEIDQWGKVTSEKGVRLQYRPPGISVAKDATAPQPVKIHETLESALNLVEQRPTPTAARVDYTQRGKLVRRLRTWRSGGSWRKKGSQHEFSSPRGVAVSGEMFVADGSHHQVHVFTTSGQYLRSFGGEGSSLGQFNLPCGVSINHSKEIIVCDHKNARCQMLTHTGKGIREFGHADSGKGALSLPIDVTVDDKDTMYVTSYTSPLVKVYSRDGTYRRSFGSEDRGPVLLPRYIQWSCGKCIVCDSNGVQLWSDSGERIRSIGARTDPAPLITPCGVTADQYGTILLMDAADNTVKVYSTTGQFVTKFPVAEYQADRYDICYLTCTPEGAVIVSDSESESVLFY